ncbi:major facilitator superfamily domain-containing protein [Leucosporidium creatinivorum]|uniref:Major facilitator superfamily domain-containing protein n=1 Tax=Leucosporidium creatinivorum TaxID=106004 RepID=A0A1Y2D721_9BASI|nr:major facilitator superfamily domain-containing protein [Leucosporidium creatinivorum]
MVRLHREEEQEEQEEHDGKERGVGSEGATVVEIGRYPPSAAAGKGGAASQTDVAEEGDFRYYEGGWRAWGNVVGAWLVLFASFGYTNAFGVYQSYYKLYTFPSHPDSDISWIGSIQLAFFFSLAVVAGPCFDRGYFQWLIRIGSAIYITSIFLIPECTKFWHVVLVQGLMSGVGVGLVFLPSMSIISHFFLKRRSFVIGIAVSGSSIGGIVFPIALNKMFSNPSIGFTNGVRITGYIIAACLLVANLIMSPHPERQASPKPRPPSVKGIFDRQYSLLVAGAFLAAFGLFFPNFYIQVFCQVNGLSENLSFYSLAIFNGASVIGRTVPNLLADHLGPLVLSFEECSSSLNVALCCRFGATSAGGAIVVSLLDGFFSGAYISLVSPVIISLSRNIEEIGLRQGFGFIIVGLAALGGNPIAGRLLANNNNNFNAPITFAGVMLVAGSVCMFYGRFLQAKVKGTWRV